MGCFNKEMLILLPRWLPTATRYLVPKNPQFCNIVLLCAHMTMLYVNDEQNKHCVEQSRPENAVLSQVKHCFLWYWHNLAEVSASFPTSSLSVPFCTDSLWHTVTVASIASFPYIQVFFFLYRTPSVHRSRPGG